MAQVKKTTKNKEILFEIVNRENKKKTHNEIINEKINVVSANFANLNFFRKIFLDIVIKFDSSQRKINEHFLFK